MRRIETFQTGARRSAVIVVALFFTGCSILSPEPDSQPAPEPVEPETRIVIEAAPPTAGPEPAIEVPAPPPLPSVAIVMSSGQSAYAEVARELATRLNNHDIYDLSDGTRAPVSVLRLINDSDTGVVVAIGLRAALSSVAMSESPVIFSQVFNYQDHGLLNDNSRGVAAIAPLDAQLAAWKEFDPAITRVGVIIGEGHDELIAEAELAAQSHDVELQVHVSRSDQETLYFFKRMIRDIDGFWLLPDNRILSHRALQQIMDDAGRQQVPVLAPNESMLSIGASVTASSVAADVAETITSIIRRIEAGNIARVPAISKLSRVQVKTATVPQVVER